MLLLIWLLSRPVTREDCPIVVLSSSWDQYLTFFILLLIVRCKFLVQTFEKLHLFLIFILLIFNGLQSDLFWIRCVWIPMWHKRRILPGRLARWSKHPSVLRRLQHVASFDIFNVVIRRSSEQLGEWLIVSNSSWWWDVTAWVIKLLLSFLCDLLLPSPVRLGL